MTYQETGTAIAETQKRTSAPFGVNMRTDAPDALAGVELLIRERVKVVL